MPSCDVRLSVRHVRVLSQNELTYSQTFFSIGYSHIILVFPYQTLWQYLDENTSNGASNARGYEKPGFLTNISLYLGIDAR